MAAVKYIKVVGGAYSTANSTTDDLAISSVALGGATIGTDKLAVTGNVAVSGDSILRNTVTTNDLRFSREDFDDPAVFVEQGYLRMNSGITELTTYAALAGPQSTGIATRFSAQTGGPADATNAAGYGGGFQIITGAGGASDVAGSVPGNGGIVELRGSAGGDASGSCEELGGVGGSLVLEAGAAGASNLAAGSALFVRSGDISLQTNLSTGGDLHVPRYGNIYVGGGSLCYDMELTSTHQILVSTAGNIPIRATGQLVIEAIGVTGGDGTYFVNNGGAEQLVGIGLWSPQYKLDVDGTIQGTALRIANGGGGLRFADGTVQSTAAAAGTDYSIASGYSVAVGQSVALYDPVTTSAAYAVEKALATGANYVMGFAAQAKNATEAVDVKISGILAGVLAGATPGGPVFLSDTGTFTQTAPTTSGHLVQRLGWAANATDMLISIGDPAIV